MDWPCYTFNDNGFWTSIKSYKCDTSKDKSECDRNRNFIRFMWGITFVLIIAQAVFVYQSYGKTSKQLVVTLKTALEEAEKELEKVGAQSAASFGQMMKMLNKM